MKTNKPKHMKSQKMKKAHFIAMLLISTVCTVNAQKISIGAKAGLNLATVTGDDVEAKMRTAFHVGGMAELPVTDKFYVQPELLFSSQGYTLDNGNDGKGILNYISLPVIGKYYVTDKLSIEAGPQLGYLLSANIKDDSTKNDIKEYFKTIDVSFGIGAGYKLDNGLNFSAHYNLGLINILDSSEESAKNGVFMLSIGYFFF